MRIGFDAKRAFFNKSGLGNYSRSTISGLSTYFPENEYHLYTPKPDKSIAFDSSCNLFINGPHSFFYKKLSSFWRTYGLSRQLVEDKIDLFHGLSNELPFGIEKSNIPSIVSIADLIFIHSPHLYPLIDRYVYKKKVFYATRNASRIVAISQQTADDLIKTCNVPDEKVRVVYLTCDAHFREKIDEHKRLETIRKYSIPEEFVLSVGTIERRKNVLSIVKALHTNKIKTPLVVIGRATPYLDEVKAFIEQNKMTDIYFLHNVSHNDLPAFYQQARLFIYPSHFEGFGIPILEALVSGTPVITSQGGCFAEVGGDASAYVNPADVADIADKIQSLLNNSAICNEMRKKGYSHAEKFSPANLAASLMSVYKEIA